MRVRLGRMALNQKNVLRKTFQFAQDFFGKEKTGHDWWHTYRVYKLALQIASREGGDLFIIEMSALLHDIGDYKFFNGDEEAGKRFVYNYLHSISLPLEIIEKIVNISTSVSFMKTLLPENKLKLEENNVENLEYLIISDADRLDAMGAIGIARAFTYGGYYHRPIYDPDIPLNPNISREEYKTTESPSINHFYEKLLKLKNMIYTSYGKKLALKRHRFLEQYLKQFFAEWEGKS